MRVAVKNAIVRLSPHERRASVHGLLGVSVGALFRRT